MQKKEKQAKRERIVPPLNEVAHFICGYVSLPPSSSPQCAGGVLNRRVPMTGWYRLKPIPLVVGSAISPVSAACSVFSGSVLFLFCRHLEIRHLENEGDFAPPPSGSVPIPRSQFAHQRVMCTCACAYTLYICVYVGCAFQKRANDENRNSLREGNGNSLREGNGETTATTSSRQVQGSRTSNNGAHCYIDKKKEVEKTSEYERILFNTPQLQFRVPVHFFTHLLCHPQYIIRNYGSSS